MYPSLYPFGTGGDCIKYIRTYLNWEPDDLATAERLVAKNIIPLKTGTELAVYLGISRKLIGAIALRPHKYYRAFEITKANGKKRTIHAPRVFLKTIQRYILDCVLTPLDLHEAACGFRRGFSCATGAKRHVERPFLWNIDLQDFFPSIVKERVAHAFSSIGYPVGAASVLASLCCLDGKLPQGAPTSPALANYIFFQVDVRIGEAARIANVVYTRYADDLSFSALEPINEDFQQNVSRIIRDAGFRINRGKSRLMGPKCCRQVTGLTVNEKVCIPRTKRRQLRAWFHNVDKNPAAFTGEKE
jgi:retron-type reverse transcriptase